MLITTSSFNVAAAEFLSRLRRAGFDILINPHGRKLSEYEVAALLADDVIGIGVGTEPLTRRVLAAAKELGIEVINTPDAPSAAVAEPTLGLVLDQLRRISQVDRLIRDRKWKLLMGGLLAEQTVGIVWYGRIGRRVAGLVRAFGSRVLCADAMPIEPDGVSLPPVHLNVC